MIFPSSRRSTLDARAVPGPGNGIVGPALDSKIDEPGRLMSRNSLFRTAMYMHWCTYLAHGFPRRIRELEFGFQRQRPNLGCITIKQLQSFEAPCIELVV